MAKDVRNAKRELLNQGLSAAKASKQDDFYTQYVDIQKEVVAYLEFDEGNGSRPKPKAAGVVLDQVKDEN